MRDLMLRQQAIEEQIKLRAQQINRLLSDLSDPDRLRREIAHNEKTIAKLQAEVVAHVDTLDRGELKLHELRDSRDELLKERTRLRNQHKINELVKLAAQMREMGNSK